jgi:hypothetical protein
MQYALENIADGCDRRERRRREGADADDVFVRARRKKEQMQIQFKMKKWREEDYNVVWKSSFLNHTYFEFEYRLRYISLYSSFR